ncbi:VOC family protein [Mucilaginibacter sp. AK015]|uniref:VOC family protein n=1 Tax=Mucilaginibacter sp. AK015 TaxID=2723072 RepID=UPI00161D071D|nr:VOC family protein [Mucilaginibacter sp. AK015]MBB5397467.1 catechol 2,3-dioxygenase-like lactoylglutathione lyase family enzyme [Mucilaginibacter sp. AK015]
MYKIVPLFKCTSMQAAIDFYTGVLNFKLKYPQASADGVVDIIADGAELQLTVYESPTLFKSVANVWVNDVDSLFNLYVSRGLDITGKENSPVHQGPVDQTWGNRELYVTDADGNTLRFCQEE